MTPDTELLTQYAKDGDEATFAELVRRHLDHVHSTALRLVNGDSHLAEDVCQLVFADLARKAGTLVDCHALSSWLHTSARFAAAKLVRGEQRRRQREQATLAMPSNTPETEPDWNQVRPILDETIAELPDADRDALSLRYFERKPFAEVGTALGLSENAARMRVERAMDKLRGRLASRGITSTVAALGTAMAQQMVATAPATLGAKIVQQTLAGASVAGTASAGWSMAAKFGLAALVIASLVALGVLSQSKKSVDPNEPAISAADATTNQPQSAVPTNIPRIVRRSTTEKTEKHGPLELYFVDKQTGQPIPDQTIGLRGWAKGSQTLVEKQVEVKSGKCVSPFDPAYMSDYWILTDVKDYAAVRLRWRQDMKEVIPDSYTVRLERPVLIHGKVVDPSGSPVANAEVVLSGGIGWDKIGEAPEDHEFEQLTSTTDAQGNWALNQIAEDMLSRTIGYAAHPKFSRVDLSVSKDTNVLNQLLEGSYVFHLGVAAVVSGRVINEKGEPVNDALVRVGMLDESNSRTSHTDADGRFEVVGCKPGSNPVTAIKEGYAASAVSIDVGADSAPLVLTLGEGKTLRLHIVDAKGRPIQKAGVWYDVFNHGQGTPLPQVGFNRQSDADGRIVWEHAPDVTMELRLFAEGFTENLMESIRPDDAEHEVVLTQSLFIYGTVCDADSGKLLPKFRLSIGTIEPAGNGEFKPWWSPIDRFNPEFVGGEFRKSLDEPVIGRTTNMGFILRFAAEGYKPEVTRLYQPNEGMQVLNINLHKGNEVQVTVYKPDGGIASGAEVGLMAPGVELTVGKGSIAASYFGNDHTWTRTADAKGQFTLPDDDYVKSVMLVHSSGFVSLSSDDLRQTGSARLEPWGKVSGVLMKEGGPAANEDLSLMPDHQNPNPFKLRYADLRTRTDSEGKFEFTQVPGGIFQVYKWTTHTNSDGQISQSGNSLANVELKGGESRELSLEADARIYQSKR